MMNRIITQAKLICIVICCLFFNQQSVEAAIIIESFEEGIPVCGDQNNAFSSGCIDDWIAVSGSPNIGNIEEPFGDDISVPDGDLYARCYTGVQKCPDSDKLISESFAFEYPFKKCTNYQIQIKVMRRTVDSDDLIDGEYDSKISFVLATGFQNESNPISNCDFFVPGITSEMQLVREEVYTSSHPVQWETLSFNFYPEDDYSQFVIIPEYTDEIDGGVFYYLDYFVMTIGDSPEFPDFYLTTENNPGPLAEICYGEDVWVCLSDANFNWINTQFTIYKEPAGSFYSKTGTVYGVDKNGCYNLTQFIRNRGNALFKQDQEYTVKMSIQHPICGWIHTEEKFKMICCEDELDAGFTYNLDDQGGTLDLEVKANYDYSEIDGQHTFTVEVDVNNDGIIDDQDDIHYFNSSSFTLGDLNPDFTYYIDHCIETPCGTTCHKEEIDFCRDCELECSVSGFSCLQNEEETYISWASGSATAQFYFIQVIVNDPGCGCQGPIEVLNLSTIETFIRHKPQFGCFSYRVRPFCALKGGFADWSEKVCANCNDLKEFRDDDEDSPEKRNVRSTSIDPTLAIHPNPFDNFIQLQIAGFSPENTTIEIFSMTGQLLFHEKYMGENTIDLSNLTYQGILIVKVSDGQHTLNQKMMKM